MMVAFEFAVKRELADLHLVAGFFGFGFRQPDAADLRLAVSAARECGFLC